jgi:hypothetical protein
MSDELEAALPRARAKRDVFARDDALEGLEPPWYARCPGAAHPLCVHACAPARRVRGAAVAGPQVS